MARSWNRLTFEDIQRVFKNGMERLRWVIANSGEYDPSGFDRLERNSTRSGNTPGLKTFSTPDSPLGKKANINHGSILGLTTPFAGRRGEITKNNQE
jgi:hypothetical protein